MTRATPVISFTQEGCREVDRIEGAEFRGHGLCRTIEDDPIDFDELEGDDES